MINDTYNSSPTALNALADLLAATPGYRRRILAAGEMRELGDVRVRTASRVRPLRSAACAKIDWIFGVAGTTRPNSCKRP